ncbi:MAG: hypothetical protein K2H29_11430 [Oscillospiraceae bacterium]|nr:hypothetical protein [Oscillospiraceae bacterium]
MKIVENGKGCSMCRRIPVLSEEDVQKLQNGEFLHKLIEKNAQDMKNPVVNHSATDTMNSVLDNLEALFGFGAVPAGDTVQEQNEVTEEDLSIDQIMYCYQEKFYLRGKRQDYTVQFCPFCGNHL